MSLQAYSKQVQMRPEWTKLTTSMQTDLQISCRMHKTSLLQHVSYMICCTCPNVQLCCGFPQHITAGVRIKGLQLELGHMSQILWYLAVQEQAIQVSATCQLKNAACF